MIARSLLILLCCTCHATKLWSSSFAVPRNASYDYVVIGGGTAGNAIAARLAEDPTLSVALVEAGGFYEIDNGNGSVVPGLAPAQFTGTDPEDIQPRIDWDFVTTSQAGAANRTVRYPRGKTLGGSSARNYLLFHRATIGYYQQWADRVQDQTYTFQHLLPYFQRSATFSPPDMSQRFPNTTPTYDWTAWNDSLHGPVHASYPRYGNAFLSWSQLGFEAAGLEKRPDGFDSGGLLGSAWALATIDPKRQERSSSQTAYLDQAIRNTNLQIYTYTLARRILFSADKTARQVEVESDGFVYHLNATKEVILSAGVFQSPHLLLLSGIGPRAVLDSFSIPVVKDLPGVGQNLQDHPMVSTSYRVNLPTSSKLVNDSTYASMAVQAYITNRTGVLTDMGCDLAWEKVPSRLRQNFSSHTNRSLTLFAPDWPEVEYLGFSGFLGAFPVSSQSDPADGYNYASIAAAVVATSSRGNISLTSADPREAPLIDPCWLCNPADVEVLLAAFKRTREIWSHLANITIGPEYWPGSGNRTDDEIVDTFRNSVLTVYHAASTCSMGPAHDEMAVVDTNARVYGVHGLRVVDASIFPMLPPGHPTATVYAIAEKIASDIKAGR